MKLTRPLAVALGIGLVFVVASDVVLIATGSQKSELWGSLVVSYWANLGFLSFLAIIGLSKLLGALLVSRPENYYKGDEGPDDV